MCSKVSSFVVDLFASIGLHLPFLIFKYSCSLLVPFPIIISVCVAGNNIRVCHALCRHILDLELDIDIFIKVLKPLVDILAPKHKHHTIDLDDYDSPPPKRSRNNLDCE